MTLTECRKRMQSKAYLERTLARLDFQSEVDLRDPYSKLAAAIILQTLLDAVYNMDFTSLDERVYGKLADGIGLNVSFDTLRDNMLIRHYVFNEPIPRTATGWMFEGGAHNG